MLPQEIRRKLTVKTGSACYKNNDAGKYRQAFGTMLKKPVLPVERRYLVYIIIQPVGKQKIGMRPPPYHRFPGGIVAGEIIAWQVDNQSFCDIPFVLVFQS